MASSCNRGGLDWIPRRIYSLRRNQPSQWLEQPIQRDSGVAIPGDLRDVWSWQDVVQQWTCSRWMVGLHDLKGLFQPKQLCDSMMFCCKMQNLRFILPTKGDMTTGLLSQAFEDFGAMIIKNMFGILDVLHSNLISRISWFKFLIVQSLNRTFDNLFQIQKQTTVIYRFQV